MESDALFAELDAKIGEEEDGAKARELQLLPMPQEPGTEIDNISDED